MTKTAKAIHKKRKALGLGGWSGYGVNHNPTPSELVMMGLFPFAKHNYVVATGKSSKLGNTQIYWIDLAWPEIKLAVEIDGCYHEWKEQQEHDAKKDSFLKAKGWTVLRFSVEQVMHDTTKIRVDIESEIYRLKAILPTV